MAYDGGGRRIGILGSAFNPITHAHLIMGSTIARRKKLDRVILLPSFQKRTDKDIHLCDEHRIALIRLAIADNPLFELDTHELGAVVGQQYTYFTMRHFKEKYPEDRLFFLMGADLLADIAGGEWVHGEDLVRENEFIVLGRSGADMSEIIGRSPFLRNHDDRFQLMHLGTTVDISSTFIREELRHGGDPRYLLPDSCYAYIREHGLFVEEA